MKIIVGAVISLPPISAGCAWNRLQYILGLRRLGHDVVFVEEVRPEWAVDASARKCAYQDSQNRRGFMEIMRQFELTEHCCAGSRRRAPDTETRSCWSCLRPPRL